MNFGYREFSEIYEVGRFSSGITKVKNRSSLDKGGLGVVPVIAAAAVSAAKTSVIKSVASSVSNAVKSIFGSKKPSAETLLEKQGYGYARRAEGGPGTYYEYKSQGSKGDRQGQFLIGWFYADGDIGKANTAAKTAVEAGKNTQEVANAIAGAIPMRTFAGVWASARDNYITRIITDAMSPYYDQMAINLAVKTASETAQATTQTTTQITPTTPTKPPEPTAPSAPTAPEGTTQAGGTPPTAPTKPPEPTAPTAPAGGTVSTTAQTTPTAPVKPSAPTAQTGTSGITALMAGLGDTTTLTKVATIAVPLILIGFLFSRQSQAPRPNPRRRR